MECFYYKGSDGLGNAKGGMVEAAGYMEAVQKLRQQGILPIKVAHEGMGRKLLRLVKSSAGARGSSRDAFAIGFCKQMSLMLEAGLPIDQGVDIALQGATGRYQQLGSRLADSLKRGYTLSESMKLAEGQFSPFIIAVTRAGEISGSLPEALGRLHRILEQGYAAKKKLQGALAYPAFLCFMSMAMVVLLIHQVLPVFAAVFASMDAQLPCTTELLLRLGDNLQMVLLYGCLGAGGLALLIRLLRRSRAMCIRLDKVLLKLPVVGRLWWQQEQAMFFGTLSMVMASGVRLNYGLELLGDMCPNAYLRFVYESMKQQLSQGYGLAKCLQRSGLYAPMVVAMVEAGERTGELAGMLDYAGKICQGEAESLMDVVNAMAEPVIILVLGLAVGFIVISTVLPILDLMTVF